MKKALTLILLSALLLSSCGRTVTDEPAVTDGTDDGIIFKDADFGGAEFKFLHYGNKGNLYYESYIVPDDAVGEAVSRAVAERNQLVEKRYNVKITAEECGPAIDADERIKSGQVDFDVIYHRGTTTADLALDGMLQDFMELDGVRLGESYWMPQTSAGLTVADRLFMAPGMISMSTVADSETYFFNKTVLDELELTSPYDHVKNGTWTYDTVYEMVMAAQKDLNDDGEMTDMHDRFGGVSGADMLVGMCNDSPLVEREDDGTYALIPYTEEMVSIYQKYKPKFDKVEYAYLTNSPFMDPHKEYSLFRADRSLFFAGNLDSSVYFNDLERGYGIVPTPVVNAGDSYSCKVDAYAPLLSVPAEADDPEMTALLLEYMAYESERLLLPAYYNAILGEKTAENEQKYEMAELIRNSATYEWERVYMYDSDLLTIREKLLSAGSFSSVVKRYLPALQQDIDDTVAKIVATGAEKPSVTE